VLFKIDDLVFDHLDPFLFEGPLHGGGCLKVMLSGKQALTVDDPMSGNVLFKVGSIHRPPNHAGTHARTEIAGNGPITGDPALGYKARDLVHVTKEIVRFGALFNCFFPWRQMIDRREWVLKKNQSVTFACQIYKKK